MPTREEIISKATVENLFPGKAENYDGVKEIFLKEAGELKKVAIEITKNPEINLERFKMEDSFNIYKKAMFDYVVNEFPDLTKANLQAIMDETIKIERNNPPEIQKLHNDYFEKARQYDLKQASVVIDNYNMDYKRSLAVNTLLSYADKEIEKQKAAEPMQPSVPNVNSISAKKLPEIGK